MVCLHTWNCISGFPWHVHTINKQYGSEAQLAIHTQSNQKNHINDSPILISTWVWRIFHCLLKRLKLPSDLIKQRLSGPHSFEFNSAEVLILLCGNIAWWTVAWKIYIRETSNNTGVNHHEIRMPAITSFPFCGQVSKDVSTVWNTEKVAKDGDVDSCPTKRTVSILFTPEQEGEPWATSLVAIICTGPFRGQISVRFREGCGKYCFSFEPEISKMSYESWGSA